MKKLLLTAAILGLSAPAAAECGADDGHLKVVTFNTWGLPAPIAKERRSRLPRIERWLEDSGVDVAGLQEVWRGALKLLKTPLQTGSSDAGDNGLALRSPHPLTNRQVHAFTAERGFDAWKAKGVLSAEVTIDEAPVTVAVTHLQSGGGSRNADVRAQQVDELLQAVGSAQTPLVLMGDFNFYDDEAIDAQTHARLLEAGFIDAAGQMGATRGTYPGLKHRFDRVYVRSRCGAAVSAEVVVDTEDLSDHRPVMVELSL